MSSLKEFEVTTTLGSGTFSSVYKARRISDGQIYALKKVKFPSLSSKERENALNEVRILASISDQNIIGYKEAFYDEASQSLCIIMEFASGGDLLKIINDHKKKGVFISEETVWSYLIQMAQGLKTLHDMKILHRDLKGANVFLGSDGKTIKLGDLNVSKIAQHGLVYTQTGTPYYTSPEIWQDKPYGAKTDIWSLGCVAYELCSLQPPFRANSMKGLCQKVLKGVFDKIPSYFSQELSSVIGMCLNVQPNMRPSCDKILAHPSVVSRMQKINMPTVSKSLVLNDLLNTIKVPRNMKKLSEILPKANYKVREVASLMDLDEKLEFGDLENRPSARRPLSRQNKPEVNLAKKRPTPSFNDLDIRKESKENSIERMLKGLEAEVGRHKKKMPSVAHIDPTKKPERVSELQRAGKAVLMDIFRARGDQDREPSGYLVMDNNSILENGRLPPISKPSSRGGNRNGNNIINQKDGVALKAYNPGRAVTPVVRSRKASDDILSQIKESDRIAKKEKDIFYGNGPRPRIVKHIY